MPDSIGGATAAPAATSPSATVPGDAAGADTPRTPPSATLPGDAAGLSTPATPPSARRMWAILGIVLVADALDLLDATITNIAAPSIVSDLGGGPALVKWLGAAYALALGSLLVVGGRLGDRYGQRRLFLVGMTGFTLASAACGLSAAPALLVTARVFQGAFGALLIPQGMAIMTKTFPREMLTKAFGAFGPLLGISAVGGPILAGFVIDADLAGLGWRPVFLINIVLGGLGLLAASFLLPRDTGDATEVVDVTGSVLLASAMFGCLYGLVEGSSDGWTALPVAALVAGAVLFAAFCRRQATAAAPLIARTLLRNRGFTSGLTVGLVFFAAVTGLNYVISLYLQNGLGYTPGQTSRALVPLTIGIIVASGACMALIGRLGRLLVLAGLLVTMAGTGVLLAVVTLDGTHPAWWRLAAGVFTVGLGMGTCIGSIFDTALGDVDAEDAGGASGSLSAVQQLAAAVGSASVTSVYLSVLGSSGQTHAMTLSLALVLGITALCLPAVRLLPRKAAQLEHA